MASVGMLVIATNKYIRFAQQLHDSARKHFLPGHELTMFVFTNMPDVPAGTVRMQHEHAPWPSPTLMRYHVFTKHAETLSKMDYLYYSDVDMRFVDKVGDEVLGELVATIHPGFWNKPREQFSYETRPESKAYIPPGQGEYYFAGGFNGGRSNRFLAMAKEISGWVDEDAKKGMVAVWHDESYLERYMVDHPPTIRLSPSYCFPEAWDLPFPKKLLALDKNHAEMRS